MGYADNWVQIKAKFEADNDAIAETVKKTKAKLLAEKAKTKPKDDKVKDLEAILANTAAVKKKKTGLSQVLPVYDKLLDRMDALVAAKHDPADAKVWKPLYQGVAKMRPQMDKANKAAQTIFGSWEAEAIRSYGKYAKTPDPASAPTRKILQGKNKAARILLDSLAVMQRDMIKRMMDIDKYLGTHPVRW